jgi:putative toxin-antitoxin system antitoxin component (TIGR02293 family)
VLRGAKDVTRSDHFPNRIKRPFGRAWSLTVQNEDGQAGIDCKGGGDRSREGDDVVQRVQADKAPVLTQVAWVKTGVGARLAKVILGQLRVPQGEALTALQISVATVNRKAKTNAPLSPAEGERVLGVGRLLGQLQTMVRESGNPEGFDASAWLSAWMSAPVPALGGTRPLDLMDTMTGQALVSQVLAQMQSGAYA